VTSPIQIQRVYERRPVKGNAVLVDRVWPRGIKKEELGNHPWMRELGPSTELRQWFGHRPERWPEFRRRYRTELNQPQQREMLDELVAMARKRPLTLLYGARDTERNQAAVIRELLEERLQK
jgi:uncharacterized protein YeaO (DUF488 family)